MLLRAGVNSAIKSDSGDLIRHMNMEAAKCMKYANLTPNEALRLVTFNAARLFGLEDRLGSIAEGMDGDIAVFDGHPLDSFSKCVMTLVDGEAYFTHPEFNPSSPAPSQPVREFANYVTPTTPKGKVRGTVNPRRRTPSGAPATRPTYAMPADDARTYVIHGATIHVGDGRVVHNGYVVLMDGKVRAIHERPFRNWKGSGHVVDATGLHIYPGLINAATTVGLGEIVPSASPTTSAKRVLTSPTSALSRLSTHTVRWSKSRAARASRPPYCSRAALSSRVRPA